MPQVEFKVTLKDSQEGDVIPRILGYTFTDFEDAVVFAQNNQDTLVLLQSITTFSPEEVSRIGTTRDR